jgi:predicted PurR-regulated permease PerM
MSDGRPRELVQSALQLLALGALITATFWVVRPFLTAGIWATMIVVACWPLLLQAQAWLGGKRSAAVALLTTGLLLALVVPIYLGVSTVVSNADDIAHLSQAIAHMPIPQPPGWVERVPLAGEKIAASWRDIAVQGPSVLAERVTPYARDLARLLVAQIGNVGLLLVQFLLTLVIAAILFAHGEAAARGVLRFARRLAGEQGEKAAYLAGQAVRAVALGVVVTAILQCAIVGTGLAIAGVPFVAILTAISFVLAIAQIGTLPVLLGAAIWVFYQHGTGWGIVFLVFAALAGSFDNVVRPLLIRRGADLPLLLIFAGVIGGLLSLGVVGLFIGPVVLAVGYMLVVDWMGERA